MWARSRAAPRFISSSWRLSFIAESCPSLVQSHAERIGISRQSLYAVSES